MKFGENESHVSHRLFRVNGEAILAVAVDLLAQQVHQRGDVERLREKLHEIADRERENTGDSTAEAMLGELECRRRRIDGDIATAGKNLALAKDDFERELVRKYLAELRAQQEAVSHEVQAIRARQNRDISSDEEIEAAMRLFKGLSGCLEDRSARLDLIELFRALNLRIGLSFSAGQWGKRNIRLLTGGLIALGDAPLPVPLHGPRAVSESPDDGANRKEGLPSEHESATFSAEAEKSASANDLPVSRREEGVSFTKVSRGDKTPLELFIAGVRDWETGLRWRLNDEKPFLE